MMIFDYNANRQAAPEALLITLENGKMLAR